MQETAKYIAIYAVEDQGFCEGLKPKWANLET